MNTANMTHYPIQWYEGMLLSPHHFQQNDIYWEQQLHKNSSLLQPYYWGINHISIDGSALAEGVFSVTKLSAVLKDGLIVEYDAEKDEQSLQLNIKDYTGPETKSLRIFLKIPKRIEGSASQKSTKRFSSIEGGIVSDENTGSGLLAITRLKPILSLSTEDFQDNYITLPLAEVSIGLEGGCRISQEYIPPLLKISAYKEMKGSCIQYQLSQLLIRLRRKANQLAGINTGIRGNMGSVVSEQHAHIIKHMVSSLPQLEVLCFSNTAHPFDVYERLAALTGQLCSIGKSIVPPLLPKYQHVDPWSGFKQALNFSEEVVDSVSLAYSSVAFSEQEDGTFSIPIEKSWLKRSLFLEVNYSSGQREDQLLSWVKKSRLGSSSVMKTLSDRRLHGAGLTRIQRDDETGLSAKTLSLLFKIKNSVLEANGKQMYVIKPGQKLYLKGGAGKHVPVSVVLHIANEIED